MSDPTMPSDHTSPEFLAWLDTKKLASDEALLAYREEKRKLAVRWNFMLKDLLDDYDVVIVSDVAFLAGKWRYKVALASPDYSTHQILHGTNKLELMHEARDVAKRNATKTPC